MKMSMNMFLPVFLLCTVVFASAQNNGSDVGASALNNDSDVFASAQNNDSDVFASAQNNNSDVGEPQHDSPGRKALCEKSDTGLFPEMDACFHMEPEIVVNASRDCAKDAHNASEGNNVLFMKAACQEGCEGEIFKKYDDCMKEWENNPDYRRQMQVPDEALECYNGVFEKYGLDDMRYELNNDTVTPS